MMRAARADQIGGFGQMPDRGHIRTSKRERFFHRRAHPPMPMLP